jgi:hypothetical protein
MKKSKIIQAMLAIITPALLLGSASSQTAQPAQSAADPMAQKVQALLAAEGKNAQLLHAYQWIENTTVTLDGKPKPPKQMQCGFDGAGMVIRTPLGAQPEPPKASGGPIRRHAEEKKIEEVQGSMAQVNNMTARYLNASPDTLRNALATRRVAFERSGAQNYSIIINDYVKQGDKLILDVNFDTMALRGMHVRSYLSSVSDTFAIDVQYALLPDGVHYPSITTVAAPSLKISTVTTQSSFFKPMR